MNANVKAALDLISRTNVGAVPWDEHAYRSACETVIGARDELAYAVHISLPGWIHGNTDPAWNDVRSGSEATCSCGNERVILPSNPRTTFEPGTTTVILKPGKEAASYLKPIGGGQDSVQMSVWIEAVDDVAALTFLDRPLAPPTVNALIDALSGGKGYDLRKLARIVAESKNRPVMKSGRLFLFSIEAVDPVNHEVAIRLDEGIEALTKAQAEALIPHSH